MKDKNSDIPAAYYQLQLVSLDKSVYRNLFVQLEIRNRYIYIYIYIYNRNRYIYIYIYNIPDVAFIKGQICNEFYINQ
jgi:hypothetical protein